MLECVGETGPEMWRKSIARGHLLMSLLQFSLHTALEGWLFTPRLICPLLAHCPHLFFS